MATRTTGKYLLRNVYLLSAVSAIMCAALTALFSWRHLQRHQDEAHVHAHQIAIQRLILNIQANLLRSDWHLHCEEIESDVTQLTGELSAVSPDAELSAFAESWRKLRKKQFASDPHNGQRDEAFQSFTANLDRLPLRLTPLLELTSHDHFGVSGSRSHLWLAGLILAFGICGVAWLLTAIVRTQRALEVAHASLEQRVRDRTAELADRNDRLHDEVERRRELEREILTIASEEQRRIAGQLHDDLGQRLTGLALNAKILERQLSNDARIDHAAELSRQVVATSVVLRNIVRGLYPSTMKRDEFEHALDALAADINVRNGCRCAVDLKNAPVLADATSNVQLYGIIREAVANAVRHGEARNIDIRLASTSGGVVLSITDDGKGLEIDNDATCDGVGLQLMRYRADILRGSFAIESSPGGGTRVHVELPLSDEI